MLKAEGKQKPRLAWGGTSTLSVQHGRFDPSVKGPVLVAACMVRVSSFVQVSH